MKAVGDDILIADAKSLGPKTAALFAMLDIHTLGELRELGSVPAYLLLRENFDGVTLNALYGIYAAIHDIDWRHIPAEVRDRLKAEASGP